MNEENQTNIYKYIGYLNEESEKMLKETAKLSGSYYKNYTYNIFYRALKHIKGISTKLTIVFVVFAAV